MQPLTGHISRRDAAVIAQQRKCEQQLFKAVAMRRAACKQWCCLRIQHDEIGFRARHKIADHTFKLHRTGAAQRRQIKHA